MVIAGFLNHEQYLIRGPSPSSISMVWWTASAQEIGEVVASTHDQVRSTVLDVSGVYD